MKPVSPGDDVYLVQALMSHLGGRSGEYLYVYVEEKDAIAKAIEMSYTSHWAEKLEVDKNSWKEWSFLTDNEERIEIHRLVLK